MTNDIAKYMTQQVMSASPAKLVFMLYERAIGSLREAIAAIESGDVEGRWRANNRAVEIISHMWSTLDMDNGGEIAENLDRLFSFMLMRLTDVDLRNDPTPAQKVIELLEPLRDSWYDLAQGKAPNGPEPSANAPQAGKAADDGAQPAQVTPLPTSISA